MSEQSGTQPDAEKDQYPPDAQFGRQAARDAERLDSLSERGATPGRLPDDPPDERDDAPRAGSKAEPAPGKGSTSGDTNDEEVASEDSFPASDPPSSTGSTAGG
jgi:hypothetical protein